MPRYKCTVEYNGTGFSGWQKQKDAPTIQLCIEEALHAFCGQELTIYTAGRTDAGVHAIGQVFHVDIEPAYPIERIQGALNFYLHGHAVAILSVETVDATFHARFSAKKRHYQYHILNRRSPAVLDHLRMWHVPWALDAHAMQDAANHLLGTHDFTSFRDTQCQAKSALKTLDTILVSRHEDRITVSVSAQSFLHHMVRNIVGTLAMVGEGKYPPEYIQTILAARDRKAAGPTAPAWGLYFMRVEY